MENKDEIEERNVWRECFLCEEEYSDDIRINPECLHSYCFQCIEQSATTFQICPICHIPLPYPLSSLPTNQILLYWRSLSPPIDFSFQIHQTNEGDDKVSQPPKKICAEDEENDATLF